MAAQGLLTLFKDAWDGVRTLIVVCIHPCRRIHVNDGTRGSEGE